MVVLFWTLVVLIIILSGISQTLLEAIGEEWIVFNIKALLLFSVFFGGESIIVVLFYGLFCKYLGLVNNE
jgi:hypothetical protein